MRKFVLAVLAVLCLAAAVQPAFAEPYEVIDAGSGKKFDIMGRIGGGTPFLLVFATMS